MKHVTVLLLLLAVSVVFADGMPLTITLNDDVTYNLFYASYIDPDNPSAQPIFFSGSIQNTTATDVLSYYLRVGLEWNGNTLIDFNDSDSRIEADDPLGPGVVKPFTSRDIISNVPVNGFRGSLTMDGVLDENPDFEDAILATGRFPDGMYKVTVQAFDGANDAAISDQETMVITILNPVNIQLLYPGTSVGGSIVSYPTQQPTFMWLSNLGSYNFKLFEVESPSDASAEDIANDIPFFEDEDVHTTAYSYPSTAPMLEIGHTYAWQVTGPLSSPIDNGNTIESPLFMFRIENPNTDPIQMQIIMTLIQNLMGIEGMESFLNLIYDGYVPSGMVRYKGNLIDISQLNELIAQIIAGEIDVRSIIVE